MTEDHKEIWLECKCGDFSYEGRQWCQDDVFECSDHGPDCAGPVKYVRADLHETLKAENERLRAALERIADFTPHFHYVTLDGENDWGPASPYDRGVKKAWLEAGTIARAALGAK